MKGGKGSCFHGFIFIFLPSKIPAAVVRLSTTHADTLNLTA